MPGHLFSIYSPTSWERSSYETVVRSGGKSSMSPRKMRMLPATIEQVKSTTSGSHATDLQIAINEQGLEMTINNERMVKSTAS